MKEKYMRGNCVVDQKIQDENADSGGSFKLVRRDDGSRKKLASAAVFVILVALMFPVTAAESTASSENNSEKEQQRIGVGISAISPGLPAALKGVWMSGEWGIQAEWNYFYVLGMLRLDGRRIVRHSGPFDLYGFAGITGNHFNNGKHADDSINNTLMADLGAGAEVFFGKERHISIGAEFGLLIPFWSNLGLEQYDNSGLMVANFSILYWF